MTKSRHIPVQIRCVLWGQAAGRCEFSGCNIPLSYHHATKEGANLGEAAHIIGFSEDGPRGESTLSKSLASDLDNLMLLCGNCHKTIDTMRESYTIKHLREMKKAHESRIALVAGIDAGRQSHILLYGARVGKHSVHLTFRRAAEAMLPLWYPAEAHEIDIGMHNAVWEDASPTFWALERKQLKDSIEHRVRPRLVSKDISHLSVFAFAPQPLLVYLGYLLSDITAAEVYQLHREPNDWKWQADSLGRSYIIEEPASIARDPALVLSLSATVSDDRILKVVPGASIWRIRTESPNNDFLKSREQLRAFREAARSLLDRIKMRHGESATIHVFPAVPVAIAVEFGRIQMPKADLPLKLYEHNCVFRPS